MCRAHHEEVVVRSLRKAPNFGSDSTLFTRARALVPGLDQVNSVQAIQSCCFKIHDPSIYDWVCKVVFCHQVSPPDLFICFLRTCSCASNLARIDFITLPVAAFK